METWRRGHFEKGRPSRFHQRKISSTISFGLVFNDPETRREQTIRETNFNGSEA